MHLPELSLLLSCGCRQCCRHRLGVNAGQGKVLEDEAGLVGVGGERFFDQRLGAGTEWALIVRELDDGDWRIRRLPRRRVAGRYRVRPAGVRAALAPRRSGRPAPRLVDLLLQRAQLGEDLPLLVAQLGELFVVSAGNERYYREHG